MERNFNSVNGEILRYRKLLDAMVESCGSKHECLPDTVDSQPVKNEALPGKKGATALEDEKMDLSKLDIALKAVEAKLDKDEDLDKNDLKVLTLAKKVSNNQPLTDEEIAWIFGVSKMYISKIERKALDKAKKYIKKTPGKEDELRDMAKTEPRFKQHEPGIERPTI